MECKDYECQRGLGLLILVTVGAIVGVAACLKHRRHRSRGDGCCEVKGGCDCGHRHQDGHRHGHGNGHGAGRGGFDPMRILDNRFASGEIDEDEYLRRRDVLKRDA